MTPAGVSFPRRIHVLIVATLTLPRTRPYPYQGAVAHAKFLERISADLAAGELDLVELTDDDIARMAEVARTHRDARLDPTDVSVIAVAERLKVTQVATLDRRDFTVVRPRHCDALILLP